MTERLPLTYDECRARFLASIRRRSLPLDRYRIGALGPDGQALTIDVSSLGPRRPRRSLVVLSGVHGVEGYLGSALQVDLLDRLDIADLPDDLGLVVVHAVNPWGMAWWRRQNESNVDLNRNWRRDRTPPPPNDPYDELHPLLCPDTDDLPDAEPFVTTMLGVVDRHGLPWVRDAITSGQYRHADGMHFGGDVLEESTAIVEEVLARHLGDVELACCIDLHTGHGDYGTYTLLSDAADGSPEDRFVRAHFDEARVEGTGGKSGQIANGLADLVGAGRHVAVTVEFGTVDEVAQLTGALAEQWVHRRGDRSRAADAEAVWNYRCCFTPDDPAWVETSMAHGRAIIDAGLDALVTSD